MKKILGAFALSCAMLLSQVSTSQADLVSYYNFNSLSIATASAPGSGGVPTSIAANSGGGSLSLTGWTGTVDDFAGSTLNALNSDPSEESLSLVSGTGNTGNGGYLQFTASMTGLENAVISFATRGTATGFNSGIWSWSTNGTTFTAIAGSTASTSTTFATATADFTGVAALTNASTAYFRYTLSGATTAAGNNRIDNLQINASVAAVPEPTSMLLASIAGVSGGYGAWRRRKAKKA